MFLVANDSGNSSVSSNNSIKNKRLSRERRNRNKKRQSQRKNYKKYGTLSKDLETVQSDSDSFSSNTRDLINDSNDSNVSDLDSKSARSNDSMSGSEKECMRYFKRSDSQSVGSLDLEAVKQQETFQGYQYTMLEKHTTEAGLDDTVGTIMDYKYEQKRLNKNKDALEKKRNKSDVNMRGVWDLILRPKIEVWLCLIFKNMLKHQNAQCLFCVFVLTAFKCDKSQNKK